MDIWTIWLTVALVLLIIEVCTQMMWALCLAVGSLAAMACSLLGLGAAAQAVSLVIVALIVYVAALPAFKRWHARQAERISRTGMDALLGRHAVVTHQIEPGKLGRARIDGDNWQVQAPGADHVIKAGAEVSVTAYDSIILTVEELK